MATIDILLATYNGAAYLPEQLASLSAQTFTDWRVILRDDGSGDGSAAIVQRWAEAGGHPLLTIEDGRANLGAKSNFAALLEASDAPYFACCDQDDVWLPHKLEVMLTAIRAAEEGCGADHPLLAHSDLEVVDAKLKSIHPSFRAYASLKQPRAGREVIDLMTQNVVTGCASLGNAALRQSALPIPDEAIMHDWWLALVAAATGELIDVAKATVLYRQHGGNVSSPIDWSLLNAVSRFVEDPNATFRRIRAFAKESQVQAGALQSHLKDRLAEPKFGVLAEYAALPHRPFVSRKLFALRHPSTGGNFLRKIVVGLSL